MKKIYHGEMILRFIKANPRGRRTTEIIKFCYVNFFEGKESHYKPGYINPVYNANEHRGTYCSILFGRYNGLIKTFCTRVNNRWVVTEPIKGPFYTRKETKTRLYNDLLQEIANNKKEIKFSHSDNINMTYFTNVYGFTKVEEIQELYENKRKELEAKLASFESKY